MNIELTAAMAGLRASIHLLRIMANRGLLSPNEVETVYSSMMECFEAHDHQEFAASLTSNLDPVIAEIRETAQQRWIGKGETNPS